MQDSSTTNSVSKPSIQLKSIEVNGYFSWLESRLCKTIIALCTDRTPFESAINEYLPQLDVLLIRNTVSEQRMLAASLWSVYAELISSIPQGFFLTLGLES
jgi:hypothetical protein